ncbi:hypothetical protein [Streptosporangium sp. KLBMP 9127]|nr:hypothetical protein [Streptosporangium sp. KLBMP 9127]
MSATVRIVIDGDTAKVYSPFQAKDIVKAIPGSRWLKTEKVWTIPSIFVGNLHADLIKARFWVEVIRTEKSAPPPPPGTRRTSGGTWAEAMFAALSPELGEKAFRALTRVLHPDAGGSTEAMQVLNVAHDRAKALR